MFIPKIGDTVTFHFVASSFHDENCFSSDCACMAKRFSRRPAKVITVYPSHDNGPVFLDLEVDFIDDDHSAFGHAESIRDEEGNIEKVIIPLPSLQTGIKPASCSLPVELMDSGSWTFGEV